jgi:hypothetical protein
MNAVMPDFAEGLRESFPASAALFEGIRAASSSQKKPVLVDGTRSTPIWLSDSLFFLPIESIGCFW